MNDEIVIELKNAIKKIKLEIIEKQEKLDSLIEKYQELSNEEIEDSDNNVIEN